MGTWITNLVAAQYGSISDIEIVWSVIALFGLVFSIYNVKESILDYRALGTIANGRRMMAVLSVKMEIARMAIQAIFLAIGLLAMTVEDPPDQLARPWNIVALSAVFRWGLVISAILVAYQSYANYQVRRHLIRGRSGPLLPEEMSSTKE